MGSRKRVFKVASALVAIGALLGAGLQPASGYPRPGVTELVSVASDGTQADWLPVVDSCNQVVQAVNRSSDLSASGRYVAFYSSASNLVPGDSNTECDVFRRDRTAGKTERVSVASDGSQALLWGSALPSISATGRYVAFVSAAPNLVPGDTNLSDDIFVHDTKNRATTRVSVASDGTQANSRSGTPSISANGRYVAFHSQADNLVENDANGFPLDVFVHDRKTKETVKASGNSRGLNSKAMISGNGRYVAFTNEPLSDATTLDARNIYVHDLKTGENLRASQASDGTPQSFSAASCQIGTIPVCGSNIGFGSAISDNGRHVTFASDATNLVPNDTNFGSIDNTQGADIFVHDLDTRRTERVSVDSYGRERREAVTVFSATISGTGRHVAYYSDSQSPLNGYVYDRGAGVMESLSVSATGGDPEPGSCTSGQRAAGTTSSWLSVPHNFNRDGRYVSLYSSAHNLVADDTNDLCDYFVRDRGPVLGVGGFGGSPPGGEPPGGEICIEEICLPPQVSVPFTDEINDVDETASRRGANLIGGSIAYRPPLGDLYAILELESMPRTPTLAAATAGLVYGMSFSVEGKPYEVRVASTGLGSRGETTAAFGLFSCPPDKLLCFKATDLKGGFGTTGERVVFSLPLKDIGIDVGATLSDMSFFTALGTQAGGAAQILDAAAL